VFEESDVVDLSYKHSLLPVTEAVKFLLVQTAKYQGISEVWSPLRIFIPRDMKLELPHILEWSYVKTTEVWLLMDF
jgi:hypothetical protein